MQLSELYDGCMSVILESTITESTNLPPFIPLPLLEQSVINWVNNNPTQAERIAEGIYQLIKKYKEEK